MERSSSVMVHPAKEEPEAALSEMVKEVLRLVQKNGPLSKRQIDFCDDACVMRYLKAHANNVSRAARMLRATLNWREKISIEYLIADEFPAELAVGAAYVAGHDDEGRPVLVIRKKPEYILNKTFKEYLRFLIFTMEVAIAAMPPGVTQWVLIVDAGGYSKVRAPSTSGILASLKLLADHYPERLAKAFIVDAPAMLYYVWKGICTFFDNSARGKFSFAYSRDYLVVPRPSNTSKASFLTIPFSKHSRRRSASFCAEHMSSSVPFRTKSADITLLGTTFDGLSNRNEDNKSFCKLSEGQEVASSLRRRSFSFRSVAGPIDCPARNLKDDELGSFRDDDEDLFSRPEVPEAVPARPKRAKGLTWDGLVSIFYPLKKNETTVTNEVKPRSFETFRPYFKYLQVSYDEAAYRALMKPPLGGLATIVSRDLKRWNRL